MSSNAFQCCLLRFSTYPLSVTIGENKLNARSVCHELLHSSLSAAVAAAVDAVVAAAVAAAVYDAIVVAAIGG